MILVKIITLYIGIVLFLFNYIKCITKSQETKHGKYAKNHGFSRFFIKRFPSKINTEKNAKLNCFDKIGSIFSLFENV